MPQGNFEGNVTILTQNEFMFLWYFCHVVSVFEGKVDHPACNEEAKQNAKRCNYDIGHIPTCSSLQISELPASEEHKRYVTEPEALVNCVESNSSVEHSP